MATNSIAKKILDSYSSFTKTDKRIAEYILANQASIPYKTLTQVANETNSSEPSVMRFVRKLDIGSYVDFKRQMLLLDRDIKARGENRNSGITGDSCKVNLEKPYEEIMRMVIEKFTGNLSDIIHMNNADYLENAVKAICQAKVVNIFGVGYSGTIARDLMYRFSKIGLNSRAYYEESWQYLVAPNVTEKDAAIGISYSGESLAVVRSLQYAKKAGAVTIAITGVLGSALTEAADMIFCTPKVSEEWEVYSMITSVAHQAICDMLFLGVLNANWDKYSKEWARVTAGWEEDMER